LNADLIDLLIAKRSSLNGVHVNKMSNPEIIPDHAVFFSFSLA